MNLLLSQCCSYLNILHRADPSLCVGCCHGNESLWDDSIRRLCRGVFQSVRMILRLHEPMSPSQVSLNKTFLDWWKFHIGEVIDAVDLFAFILWSTLFCWLCSQDAGKMRSEVAISVPILIKGTISFSKSRFTATSPYLDSYESQAVHSRVDVNDCIPDIRSIACCGQAFLQQAFQHRKELLNEIDVFRTVLESRIQRRFC